jgi:hypothetical protein
MTDSAVPSGAMLVDAATWLDSTLLALVARTSDPVTSAPDPWRIRSGHDGAETEHDVRSLACKTNDGVTWLLTARFPATTAGAVEFTLSHGAVTHRLNSESIDAVVCSTAEFAEASGDQLTPADRIRVAGFLAGTADGPAKDGQGKLTDLLMEMRDLLRPALPVSDVDAALQFAMRFEQVVQVDERAFWLVGWVRDQDPDTTSFAVFAPEGESSVLADGAVMFYDRPDLASVFGERPDVPTVGFRAFVELEAPSRRPTGWVMQVRNAVGDSIEHVAPDPVIADSAQSWGLLCALASSDVDEEVMEHQILAAATRLAARPSAGVIEEIVDYGAVPEEPDVSIVIATHWVDRMEHQILEFAQDPGITGVEIIYAVARDRDHGELDSQADGLSALHRLPFRVVRVSPYVSRARIFNLGASVARGRLLVLMSGDVIPTGRGWLPAMRAFFEANPSVGAVGPTLLYEDGSIASVGANYIRGRRARSWKASSPLRGMAPSIDRGATARPVQAISSACIMLATDQFRALHGLYEHYIGHANEAGDLCLALAAAGLETWYLPDAQLHELERDIPEPELDTGTSHYNDWLFDSRWGTHLTTALAERDNPNPPAIRPTGPRPVVEVTAIIQTELDDSPVLDAALFNPQTTPYENTYSLVIDGWAIARNGEPLTVELRGGAFLRTQTLANVRRKDLIERFPETPAAASSGFQFVVGSLVLPLEFELGIDVVDDDGSRVSLGLVRGRRQPLRSGYAPMFQPLLITTTGRSGTNWLTALLSVHPEIMACRPFQYEAVMCTYWIDALLALSAPSSYMQRLLPEWYDHLWWAGDRRSLTLPLNAKDGGVARWLGCEGIEAITRFCQGQVDAFYQEVVRSEKRDSPRYFVERSFPGGSLRAIAELYSASREIILVRDPRDRVCSILDYNARRGIELWGRDVTNNDDEWFAYLGVEVAKLLEGWRERKQTAHVVRYEDLILEPRSTLAAIFDYVGVEATSTTISRILDAAPKILPHAQAAHKTSGGGEASIGRWRRDLSPERVAACNATFEEFMSAFGYEAT